jgi:flagellar hook protein FlgE
MILDLYKQIGNALSALEDGLKVAISNSNNFNTPGYKYSNATFTTIFSQVQSAGSDVTNPIQTGESMTLGSITTDYSQGNIGFGTALDAAISGDGFFVISDSPSQFDSQSEKAYTRAGHFQIDFTNTYLTDSFGRKVFGYKVDANGNKISNELVPIQTNSNADIGFIDGGVLVTNFQAAKDAIAASTTPPEQVPLYKLAVSSFQNKQGLIGIDGGALKATVASGEAMNPVLSGENGMGQILGASLESSNIRVAQVALDMNLLNRGFSALQGALQDVNKIVNDLLSKLTA